MKSHDESHDEPREDEAPGSVVKADYEPPVLVELGSFAELTRFNPGPTGDTEGAS